MIGRRKNGKLMCSRTLEKRRCNHTIEKKISTCGEGFESLVFWEREHDWQWKKWEMEV